MVNRPCNGSPPASTKNPPHPTAVSSDVDAGLMSLALVQT
jgi:hypothetical protein